MTSRSVALLATLACSACQALPFFEEVPGEHCDEPGVTEQVACGPCSAGVMIRTCRSDRHWQSEQGCVENRYDGDGDGHANEACFVEMGFRGCCGEEEDCDDEDPDKFPGARVDRDHDQLYDSACCDGAEDPRCIDCDDSDPRRWQGHADSDGDGFDAVDCGGTDCDDTDPDRYWDHADSDGDGHTDVACCDAGTPMCDDGNDCDPDRWLGPADLDGDGHDHEDCGGDDCDDDHPLRWLGHADVDGDGHVDDRCCPEGETTCDDGNDDDPERWGSDTDLDGDGHHDARTRCEDDPVDPDSCAIFDDCDDDCAECHPDGVPTAGLARDHDCDGRVDELQARGWAPSHLEVVGTLREDLDFVSVFATDDRVYAASTLGLHELDISTPDDPVETDSLTMAQPPPLISA